MTALLHLLLKGYIMNTAFVFPGQGSQTVGMGQELYQQFSIAKQVFEEVDDALDLKLSDLMFSGDIAELTQTENAQPAIMAVSMAVVRVLEQETGRKINELATCVAGHSLGEYSALCASGALSVADTAQLLRTRGLAMKEASVDAPGAMAAILGLDMKQVSKIVNEASQNREICVIANDNCPGQVVISGYLNAIDRAIDIALQSGAKKALKLPVSGGFHSPLMGRAADKMKSVLEELTIQKPQVPIVANITAEFEQNPQRIKELLVAQVTGSVRWTESVQYMTSQGITDFVECGNGKVLCGLIKRINGEARSIAVGNKDGITQGLAFLS